MDFFFLKEKIYWDQSNEQSERGPHRTWPGLGRVDPIIISCRVFLSGSADVAIEFNSRYGNDQKKKRRRETSSLWLPTSAGSRLVVQYDRCLGGPLVHQIRRKHFRIQDGRRKVAGGLAMNMISCTQDRITTEKLSWTASSDSWTGGAPYFYGFFRSEEPEIPVGANRIAIWLSTFLPFLSPVVFVIIII